MPWVIEIFSVSHCHTYVWMAGGRRGNVGNWRERLLSLRLSNAMGDVYFFQSVTAIPTAGLAPAYYNCKATIGKELGINVYGHTKLKTPVLVRSLKLSNFGLR
jgi:hypothetical protein